MGGLKAALERYDVGKFHGGSGGGGEGRSAERMGC